MMNSCNFIKQKIDELVIQFPSIKCSYEFDESDYTHSVEILPTQFFKLSGEFTVVENNIYNEFFELFPYEGLFFITNDVLVPVSNPFYSKQGCDYLTSVKFNEVGHLKGSLLNETINYITTNQIVFNVTSVNEVNVFTTDFNDRLTVSQVKLNDIFNNVLIKNSGENNYALAA